MKHGILSSKLLLFDDEQRAGFDQLLESLSRDLRPASTCEQILVEKIAMSYWRLHVAYGFEAELSKTQRRFFDTCDKTGRYANTIHRQLMQDMHELERLQRRHSGEAVPAPISVDVNLDSDEGDSKEELINSQSRTPGTAMPVASAGTGRRIGRRGQAEFHGGVLAKRSHRRPPRLTSVRGCYKPPLLCIFSTTVEGGFSGPTGNCCAAGSG